jgi:hypothetical protein
MKRETDIERWLRELASDEQRTDSQRAAARLLIKSPRLLKAQCYPVEITAWLEGCAKQVFVPSASTTLRDEIRVQDEVYAAGQLSAIALAQRSG